MGSFNLFEKELISCSVKRSSYTLISKSILDYQIIFFKYLKTKRHLTLEHLFRTINLKKRWKRSFKQYLKPTILKYISNRFRFSYNTLLHMHFHSIWNGQFYATTSAVIDCVLFSDFKTSTFQTGELICLQTEKKLVKNLSSFACTYQFGIICTSQGVNKYFFYARLFVSWIIVARVQHGLFLRSRLVWRDLYEWVLGKRPIIASIHCDSHFVYILSRRNKSAHNSVYLQPKLLLYVTKLLSNLLSSCHQALQNESKCKFLNMFLLSCIQDFCQCVPKTIKYVGAIS